MNPRLRILLVRAAGLTCGAYGYGHGGARWCNKPFGHSDSCMYDIATIQPESALRSWAKGYRRKHGVDLAAARRRSGGGAYG